MASVWRRVGLFLATVAPITCGDRSALERQAQGATTQRLIGTWDVRFHVDHPLASGPGFEAVERDVNGQIAFLANRWLKRDYPLMNVPSVYGVFDVDFSVLGCDARRSGETPTAVAGSSSPDSVSIILGDPKSEIAVTMRGTASRDSIVGGWQVWISRAGGGGGRFVMVRRE